MGYWKLRCRTCGRIWSLYVSYSLDKEFKRLYHYCPFCKKNTYHDILEFVEE